LIDPVSPEFNRGSFCYLPYLVYSAWKEAGADITIMENFSAADVDRLPKADRYLIALWSHPQIEHVKTLVRFLPKGKAEVFGYLPLIEKHNLPQYIPSEDTILSGMKSYIKYFADFTHILLSDCDMHLKALHGQVFPMFTSYGCPNRCSFCPSSRNQPKRLIIPVEDVCAMIDHMAVRGRTSIHFTDEDFLFDADRALTILEHITKADPLFQLIMLTSRASLSMFLERFGDMPLRKAGVELLEVGLETAYEDLGRQMGKVDAGLCETLAQACSIPILWLTLTFAPGETLRSLRATGDFLRKWGQKPETLYSRIATNGTVGGLGQFYQPYEGTRDFYQLPRLGKLLTSRPLRLLPSFIPYSFVQDIVKEKREVTTEDLFWFDLHRVPAPTRLVVGQTIDYHTQFYPNFEDGYISLAIAARLGVIG